VVRTESLNKLLVAKSLNERPPTAKKKCEYKHIYNPSHGQQNCYYGNREDKVAYVVFFEQLKVKVKQFHYSPGQVLKVREC
jgi:hypothetical protein